MLISATISNNKYSVKYYFATRVAHFPFRSTRKHVLYSSKNSFPKLKWSVYSSGNYVALSIMKSIWVSESARKSEKIIEMLSREKIINISGGEDNEIWLKFQGEYYETKMPWTDSKHRHVSANMNYLTDSVRPTVKRRNEARLKD